MYKEKIRKRHLSSEREINTNGLHFIDDPCEQKLQAPCMISTPKFFTVDFIHSGYFPMVIKSDRYMKWWEGNTNMVT